jgi:hypothetical protein
LHVVNLIDGTSYSISYGIFHVPWKNCQLWLQVHF